MPGKRKNTFRFKPFNELITEIDVRKSALYHIEHENEELSDNINESYFHQALVKWSALNLTPEFHEFYKKCLNIITLPQLLHDKNYILELLSKKISPETSELSIEPFLDLCYVLAKDLANEHFDDFKPLFSNLIKLIINAIKYDKHDEKTAKRIELSLTCLANLFKNFKLYFKRNINILLEIILPILIDDYNTSQYIRTLINDCFAFIMRDLRDYKILFTQIDQQLNNITDEDIQKRCIYAYGNLLFKMCSSVPSGTFHNNAGNVLNNLFQILLDDENKSELNQKIWYNILTVTLLAILKEISFDNATILMNIIQDKFKKIIISDEKDNIHPSAMNCLMGILLQIIKYKNGSYLTSTKSIIDILNFLMDNAQKNCKILSYTSQLICSLLISNSNITIDNSKILIKKYLITIIEEPDLFEEFMINICEYEHFEKLCFKYFIRYFEENVNYNGLKLFTDIILKRMPSLFNFNHYENNNYNDDDYYNDRKLKIKFQKPETMTKLLNLIENLNINLYDDGNDFYCLIYSLIILSKIDNINFNDDVIIKFRIFMKNLCELSYTDAEKRHFLIPFGILFENYIDMRISNLTHDDNKFIWHICSIIMNDINIQYSMISLRILNFIFKKILTENSLINNSSKNFYYKKLAKNKKIIQSKISYGLCSSIHEIRFYIISILKSMYDMFSKYGNLTEQHSSEVYKLFYKIELSIPSIHTYRQQLMSIQKLSEGEFFESYVKKSDDYTKFNVLYFLFGTLYRNFRLIWSDIEKGIISVYNDGIVKTDSFWSIYKTKLDETAKIIRGEIKKPENVIEDIILSYDQKTTTIFNGIVRKPRYNNFHTTNYIHYRNLLWRNLINVSQLCEIKNRDLVIIFEEFVNKEFNKINSDPTPTWYILCETEDDDIDENTNVNDNNDEEEETSDKEEFDSDEEDDNDKKTEEVESSDEENDNDIIEDEIDDNEDEIFIGATGGKEEEENDGSTDEEEEKDDDDDDCNGDQEENNTNVKESDSKDNQEKNDNAEKSKINDNDGENEIDQLENDINNKLKLMHKKKNRKQIVRKNPEQIDILNTLRVKLHIFANFSNPKALYNEKFLYKLYFELLKSPNRLLQKGALNCILKYKKKITHNKELLHDLVESQNLRDVLQKFKLNEHINERKDMVRILLHVLYGKLFIKPKKPITKENIRSYIIEFVRTFNVNELTKFLNMIFVNYKDILKNCKSLDKIPNKVKNIINFENIWSPKRLRTSLNFLRVLKNNFCVTMHKNILYYILKIQCFIGSTCNEVLYFNYDHINPQKQKMNKSTLESFKKLRSECLKDFHEFMERFHNEFKWINKDIDCIFNIFVYPQLSKLHIESLHSPTPLFNLISVWCKHRCYYPLLLKKPNNEQQKLYNIDPDLTPMQSFMNLLSNNNAKIKMHTKILDLIGYLINDEDYSFQSASLINTDKEIYDVIHDNNGMCINVTVLDIMKMYFRPIVQKLHKMIKNKLPIVVKMKLYKRSIYLLSRLTVFMNDSNSSLDLLNVFIEVTLTIIKKSGKFDYDLQSEIINTIRNLIKSIKKDNTNNLLRKIAPYYELISCSMIRQTLSSVLKDINANMTIEHIKIINDLDIPSYKNIDEPEIDDRFNALQKTRKLIENYQLTNYDNDLITYDFALIMIYNCLYFLKYEKDLAINTDSIDIICDLLTCLINSNKINPNDLNYLFNFVILNFIKNVLQKDKKTDSYKSRNNIIQLLSKLSSIFYNHNETLYNLNLFHDDDIDNDFFNNTISLQKLDHEKSLRNLCQIFKEMKNSNKQNNALFPKTLINFLLPIIEHYIMNEQYKTNTTLLNTNYEVIYHICEYLPWSSYNYLLRYYFNQFKNQQYQKQIVKVLIVVLDGFHFNLSNGFEDHIEVHTALEPELDDNEEMDDNKICVEKEIKIEQLRQIEPVTATHEVLSTESAKSIIRTFKTFYLPKLLNILYEPANYDKKHKLNRDKKSLERAQDDCSRILLAVPTVKVLQKLPKKVLEDNITTLLTKVCLFLKSPLISVRKITSDTLGKMMIALNCQYLDELIKQLRILLNRGYQIHVLSVTVYNILNSIEKLLKPKHIKLCLNDILQIMYNDIFGLCSEEKNIRNFTSNTPEAKPTLKSYLVLNIVSKYCDETSVVPIIKPLIKHIKNGHSKKVIIKIQQCLQHIQNGFNNNLNINLLLLLALVYGLLEEKIPSLSMKTIKTSDNDENENDDDEDDKPIKVKRRRISKNDCFLLPNDPRTNSTTKRVLKNIKTNSHLIIEFSLEILYTIFNKNKFDDNYENYLYEFIPIMVNNIKSSYLNIQTSVLKCLRSTWNNEYFKLFNNDSISYFIDHIFDILYKYSSLEFNSTSNDDNTNLLRETYKTIQTFINKCTFYEITDMQYKKLLSYIESDIHKVSKQTIIYPLLKTIINKRVDLDEIHDLIDNHICRLSIISDSDKQRSELRQIVLIYIIVYRLHNKSKNIINFYLTQLNYKENSGTISAIQFFMELFDSTLSVSLLNPKNNHNANDKLLTNYIIDNFFVEICISLSTLSSLSNDNFLNRLSHNCTKLLINNLNKYDHNTLKFNRVIVDLIESKIIYMRLVGINLLSCFIDNKRYNIFKLIPNLLELLVSRLKKDNPKEPGRYVRILNLNDNENDNDEEFKGLHTIITKPKNDGNLNITNRNLHIINRTKIIDYELFSIQKCLCKIILHNPELFYYNNQTIEFNTNIDDMLYTSQHLLSYGHEWIRTVSLDIFNNILQKYDFNLISKKLKEKHIPKKQKKSSPSITNGRRYIYEDPQYDIKSLTLDICAQLEIQKDKPISNTLIELCLKNLLHIAQMIKNVPFNKNELNENQDNDVDEEKSKTDNDNNDNNVNKDENKKSNSEIDDEKKPKMNLNWLLRILRNCIHKEIVNAPHSIVLRTAIFKWMEDLIEKLDIETLKLIAHHILQPLVRELLLEDNIDKDLKTVAKNTSDKLRKKLKNSTLYGEIYLNIKNKLQNKRLERRKQLAIEKINDPARAIKRKASERQRKKQAKKLKTDVMRGKAEGNCSRKRKAHD